MVRHVRNVRPDRTVDRVALTARIVESFQRLGELASESHTDDLLAVDITMQQAKALHVIASEPGIGMTALATRLGVGLSTTSASIDRLAEMRLIERRHDEQDRRHVVLTLSDEGRAVVDRFRDVGVGILREYLPHLRPAELVGLQTGLDGLLRVMGARTPPRQPIRDTGAHGTP